MGCSRGFEVQSELPTFWWSEGGAAHHRPHTSPRTEATKGCRSSQIPPHLLLHSSITQPVSVALFHFLHFLSARKSVSQSHQHRCRKGQSQQQQGYYTHLSRNRAGLHTSTHIFERGDPLASGRRHTRASSDPLYHYLPQQQAPLSLISVCVNSSVMVTALGFCYLYALLMLVGLYVSTSTKLWKRTQIPFVDNKSPNREPQ